MAKHIKGKVVWITGASSGIGAALADEFSAKGAKLILSARRADKLREVAGSLPHQQDEMLILPLDVTDSKSLYDAVNLVVDRFGRIDFLINNSGISQRSKVGDTIMEVDRRVMEVNYFGTIALTKMVLPYMLEQGSGHLACTSSIVGKFGFPLRSAYAASKHALHGFFDSLRAEYPGIDVTIIIPGRIHTGISHHALLGDGEMYGKMDEGQTTGLSAKSAARKIVKALETGKKEVLVGKKELLMVYIRKFLPGLYYRMARKVRPT